EPGTRPSCALPYELYADCRPSADGKHIEIGMRAGDKAFGPRSAGAPFKVYARGNYRSASTGAGNGSYENCRNWDFAVPAGGSLTEQWPLEAFENGQYHLHLYGPNGF